MGPYQDVEFWVRAGSWTSIILKACTALGYIKSSPLPDLAAPDLNHNLNQVQHQSEAWPETFSVEVESNQNRYGSIPRSGPMNLINEPLST